MFIIIYSQTCYLLYLHNSSDDTHPFSIIVNYRHFSSYHFCLFCFTLLVYSLSFSFRKIIDRSILMKEIIIVYCCRLPKQCVFIWFQIHYIHLHNTDAFQSVCLKMATFSFVLASRPRQNDQKRSFKKGCLNWALRYIASTMTIKALFIGGPTLPRIS